jgi:hypothetical protein
MDHPQQKVISGARDRLSEREDPLGQLHVSLGRERVLEDTLEIDGQFAHQVVAVNIGVQVDLT